MWIYILVIVSAVGYLIYASFSIRAGIYVKSFCKAEIKEKVVAFTFDDGPDGYLTPMFLKVLEVFNVKATFFCTGKNAERYPDIVRQIHGEGHLVCSHSYSHSNFFPFFTKKKMIKDMLRAQTVLEGLTGEPVKYFRPPFGVTNPTVAKAIHQLGYTSVGWSVRSLDTVLRPPKKVTLRIVGRMRPGSVILLHDRMEGSCATLLNLLAFFDQLGYKAVRLDELMNLEK